MKRFRKMNFKIGREKSKKRSYEEIMDDLKTSFIGESECVFI